MRGLSLVAASGGHSSSRCAGLSLLWPLLLRSTSSRRAGSVVVAHGPSCSAACGIFPDQGLNPCPLPWQADSQPLHHQGSPKQCSLLVTLALPFLIFGKQLTVLFAMYIYKDFGGRIRVLTLLIHRNLHSKHTHAHILA